MLVQSVGNYADAAMHTHARVGPDQRHTNCIGSPPSATARRTSWRFWYSGQDVFEVTLIAPDGREFSVALDTRVQSSDGDTVWGNFYHRLHEPNSGLNHVVIFSTRPRRAAAGGCAARPRHRRRTRARVDRTGCERALPVAVSPRQATSGYTTNTICNCFRAIAVGAYDASRSDRPATLFSSRGPTADGRQKPELARPATRFARRGRCRGTDGTASRGCA